MNNESQTENDPGVPSPPADPPKVETIVPQRSRVVVVETVYHKPADYHAESVISKYSSPIESNEQRFNRRTTAGPSWTELKGNWIESASLVTFRNDAKSGDLLILEIGLVPSVESDRDMFSEPVSTDVMTISPVLPGESCRFRPIDVTRLRVRSATDDPVPFTVNVYPA